MKNNVLVIGGNGFIGKNLCAYLNKIGKRVTSFDLTLPKHREENIQYVSGDFFHIDTLKKLIKNQDIIFHCISTINPTNSVTDYMRGYEKDFIQTIRLFDLIKETSAKVIFLSSGGTVYGDVMEMPISENTVCNPKNHYGNLKLCIENFIRTYNKVNHQKHLIARISNPYGPGQDSNKGVGFIDAVIRKAICKETIEVWGDGEIVRDYIYIDDVCKMLYALAEHDGEEEVFNLSSNQGVTQNKVIAIVREHIQDLKVEYRSFRAIDAKKIVLCNQRIRKIMPDELTNIEEGIHRYLSYLMKENQYVERNDKGNSGKNKEKRKDQ